MVKRVLVCGGRDYKDWENFRDMMEALGKVHFDRHPEDLDGNYLYNVIVIHGGATGADQMAQDWAAMNWCDCTEFPADWKTHGKKAGPIRNKQMLDEGKPEMVVAFPGGKGTANMIAQAVERNIPVVKIGDGTPPELKTEKYRKEFIKRVGEHFGSMPVGERHRLFFELLKEEEDFLKRLAAMDEEYNEIMSIQNLVDGANPFE